MAGMTLKEREEREALIKQLLEEGKTRRQIAEEIGISTQSLHVFMKTRGWTDG